METFNDSTNRQTRRLSEDPRFVELARLLADQEQERIQALLEDLEDTQPIQALLEDLENPQVSEDLATVLREAIDTSGKTQYQLAQETGIDKSALSRFVSGERGLTLDTAAKLAAALNLELKPASRRRKRAK